MTGHRASSQRMAHIHPPRRTFRLAEIGEDPGDRLQFLPVVRVRAGQYSLCFSIAVACRLGDPSDGPGAYWQAALRHYRRDVS